MSNQPLPTTLDAPLITPFPKNIPVEIVGAILSFASTSTLIAACGASFALLSLAAPLLYGNVQVDGHDISKMIYHRYLSKPPSYPPPFPPAPPLSNEYRLLPYLSSLPLTIAAIRRANADRHPDLPKISVDALVVRLDRYHSAGRFSSITFPLLHPRQIIFLYPLRTSNDPNPVLVGWASDRIGRDQLQEVRMVNHVQLSLAPSPLAPLGHQGYIFPRSRRTGPFQVSVVLDWRALTLVDRGSTERTLISAKPSEKERGAVGLGSLEVWVRDEREKMWTEKLLGGKLGWDLRGGELVKVVA